MFTSKMRSILKDSLSQCSRDTGEEPVTDIITKPHYGSLESSNMPTPTSLTQLQSEQIHQKEEGSNLAGDKVPGKW